ncbi:MAG: DUF2892 domain-containing protein [Truepera sp.]|nr:DUF2892 domain-containing protein [Truepera sp.]
MKVNVGTTDRILRVIVGLVAALMVLFGGVGGVLAVVLGIVAAALLLTAALGHCGLYRLIGITTCPRR